MAEDGERLAYKWKVLISVVFGIFMVILDTTVVNVAFQTLRREFGASLADAQWIISVYVLALGIATPLAGFLADRFGSRRVYLTGLGGFVAGSLLCGVAPGLWTLVGARALQGLGGGLALPLASALLLRTFPPEEQGRALGIFGVALVVAPALGPILGGWLVDLERWRWIFFINVPIGIVGLTLASRFLRPDRGDARPGFDAMGLVTEVIGFGAILYAASVAEAQGWDSPAVLRWFAVGAAGLVAFAVVELRVAREPLLDLRLFRNRVFLLATLTGYVSVLALFGAEFLLPVYLQSLRGLSALDTGMTLLPLAIAAGVATPVAGRLYDRVGPRPLMVVGFSLLVVNTWQLAQLTADTPLSWIVFLLVLRGLALGLTVQNTLVTALSVVPGPELARASSLVNSLRQVVQSLGVALLATVLASTQSPETRALGPGGHGGTQAGLCEVRPVGPAVTPGAAPVVATPSLGPVAAPGSGADATLVARACDEGIRGFERAYRLTFYLAIVAVLLGAMLPGWPGRWAGRQGHAPAALE